MELRCGIIGLPNVGKSRLFNAAAKAKVPSANFPFCTIKPNEAMVSVPDERLLKLSRMLKPEKTIPTTIFLVDIAGLVKGASKGEGLGNQFLGHIRDVDALIEVVRCFDDEKVIHVGGGVDPAFDHEIINDELRLADLGSLERRVKKIEKYVKAGRKEALREKALLDRFIAVLSEGKDARSIVVDKAERAILAGWHLLTAKKMIYVANIAEAALGDTKNRYVQELEEVLEKEEGKVIPICVAVEEEVSKFSDEEQTDFLEIYGLKKTSLHVLLQAAYEMLDLITFFTAGPKEVRAWTVERGTLAPQAAGVIHSDFEKNFIKAEVIKYEDYIALGGEEACKRAGKLAVEGKSYVVEDGDVIHFKCGK